MEIKTPAIQAKWTGRIRGPAQVAAHKACPQRNATKLQAIRSHQLLIRELRSRKLGRRLEALPACSNPKVKTS